MAVVGLTADGKKIVRLTAAGPTSYAAGGFVVRVGELNRIYSVNVSVQTNLKVNDYVHAVDYSYSDNAITFVVNRINVTSASPSTWAEVPNGTDISALKLEIECIGT